MKIVQEFKAFAMKGNVVDMAVGIIIGLAFGKIVTSIVNDLIMPPIGLLLAGVNFKELQWVLKAASGEDPAVAIKYGNFIQSLVDFLIIAFTIFVIIRLMNSTRRKEAEAPTVAPPPPTKEELLLTEIRDLLKK